MSQDEAAELVGSNVSMISLAKRVLEEASEKAREIESGEKRLGKVLNEINEAHKQKAKENKPPFIELLEDCRLTTDATFSVEDFSKNVEELSTLIDKCDISAAVGNHAQACYSIAGLDSIVALAAKIDLAYPLRDIEKNIATFEAQKDKQHNWIIQMRGFINDTYPQWHEKLVKQAVTDEDKKLLVALEQRFAEFQSRNLEHLQSMAEMECTMIDAKPRSARMEKFMGVLTELADLGFDAIISSKEDSLTESEATTAE